MPLLKPIISKKVDISSLPIVSARKSNLRPLYTNYLSPNWLPGESKKYLETMGRLLILALLSEEASLNHNKHNHDNHICGDYWIRCHCNYAKAIRAMDLGIKDIERVRKVI